MPSVLAQRTAAGFLSLVFFLAFFLISGATSVHAQSTSIGDPASTARIQLGSFGFTPRLAVRNLGIDRNVFNATTAPEQDVTASFVSSADAYLRLGRARLMSKSQLDYNYFQKSASQRSVNFSQDGRVELDLIHFVPFVTGTYVRTRQRPNLAIDERVAQIRTAVSAGGQVPIGSRARVDFELAREHVDLGQGAHGDPALAQSLNRTSVDFTISGRRGLTALTTLIGRGGVQRDRFEFSTLRDSNRIFVLAGLEFKPTALLSGQFLLGPQRFVTLREGVPDYTGIVGSADIRYTVRDTTRIGGRFTRDVDYSDDIVQPYFVTTGAEFEVTQSIGSAWSVLGRAGHTVMAYQNVTLVPGSPSVLDPRRDPVDTFGVGVSRKIGLLIRVGADADWSRRSSVRATQVYNGFKFGGFLTYGY